MLAWALENLIVVPVLALLVLSIQWIFRPRPAMRHGLWLLVFLKFIIPPLLSWPHGPRIEVPSGVASPTNVRAAASETPSNPSETLARRGNDPRTISPGTEESSEARSSSIGWTYTLSWFALRLWIAGSIALLITQVSSILRIRRLLGRAESAPRWLTAEVRRLARALDVSLPTTRILPAVGSPFIWSLGPAKLMWPKTLLHATPNRWREVIAHELAHLHRRDHWVAWVETLGLCLWWWNPFYWMIRHQVRYYAELACDAWAVSLNPSQRRTYAEALLTVSQLDSKSLSLTPTLGAHLGEKRAFAHRLRFIFGEAATDCALPRRATWLLVLLAITMTPGWVRGELPPAERESGTRGAETSPSISVWETPSPGVPVLILENPRPGSPGNRCRGGSCSSSRSRARGRETWLPFPQSNR